MNDSSSKRNYRSWPASLGRGLGIALLVATVALGIASAGSARSTAAPSNTTTPSINGSTSSRLHSHRQSGSLERYGTVQLRLSVADL